jgi:predicted transcriptional regulator
MRKIKEVLRLRSLGRKQREIADSCSISQSTVHEYLKAAEAAGKSWPEIADWDDVELEKAHRDIGTYLSFQLQRLEAQWLAQQSPAAGANFAPANPENPKRDEMMLMKFP